MAQESRLAVTIDSRGAKRNADDLAESLKDVERAGEGATTSTEGLSSSLDEQRRELSQLLGQINPTVAALGRLDDMQEKLAKFKGNKFLDSDTFDEYSHRINTMRDALGESATSMNKAGMSAKAYQASLRGIPAQFTDIVVSLQAGQPPLQVLLQQGGQLKDMFGGVGPAARALGGYVAGLVNPFTAAAAAAGVLAVAYYQGSEETERFANALIENGNAAGLSANQLADMANQVAASSGTVGAAAGVLTQLAAAGNPLRTMYVEITQASLAWSKQTGRDITEVVQTFNEIGKNPVDAIKKLDGELNILTASQYANIQSLQEQGKTMDAAAMAAGLYAEAINSRAGEIERNLGTLESAWQSITGAAKKAWDAMLDVGRDQTIEEQIANTEKLIAQRKGGIIGFFAGDDDQTLRGLETRLKQLQTALANNAAKAAQDASNKATQDAGKKGIDLINSTYKSSLTQTQKLQKELTDLDKARKDAIAAGGFSAAEEEKYAKSRKNIEQEIADIKAREAKKNAPKGVNKGVSEAETTFSRLYNQYDPAAQAARTLTKEQTQLQLALDKGKISQDEYGKALAQASQNYAATVQGQDQHLVRLKQINEEYVKGQSLAELYAQKSAATGIQGPAGKIAQAGIDSSINNQVFSGKPNTSQIDAVIGGAGSELMRMTQENEQLQAWYDQRIAMYQQYRELEVENAAQYDETIKQLEKQRAEDTLNNERSMSVARLSLAEGMFGDLTSIVGAFAGQQSGAYKAMFAVQKAASIAQSIISIQTGIAMAAANPFPLNLAAMASVAAATASIVGNIQSVGLNLATGGYVRGPGTGTSDSIPANLSNGEFVVNAAATKRNRALLEAINSNERVSVAGGSSAVVSTQAGSSGASGIQQNIYIQNHTTAQVEQRRMPNGDLEFVIREAADRAVQEVAGQLASGYGDVVSAGEGAYGWKRPGD